MKKVACFEVAKKFYDSAETVDLLAGYTNIGRAVLHLVRGEVGRAEKTLSEVEAFHRESVPALLACACVHFNKGRYVDALNLYRDTFKVWHFGPSPNQVLTAGKILTPPKVVVHDTSGKRHHGGL